MAETELSISDPFKDFGLPLPEPVVSEPEPTKRPVISDDEIADPFVDFGIEREPAPTKSAYLSVEDVINDPQRLGAIRGMMSKTKDVYYETAPAEEVMEAFMAHMRWMNTNEVSTGAELVNVMSADEETKALYGGAYKIYDEMGNMFQNGDAWNGILDYSGAFVTSPSLWLGVGLGKVAGAAGTRAAANKALNVAIGAAAKQVAAKSAGKVTEIAVRRELKNTAAKAAAKYHIAGALAVEAPLQTVADYMRQSVRLETNAQDEFSYLDSAIATVAGGVSAIPGIAVLRSSSESSLAEAGQLLDNAFKQRAATAAKRAAPKVKASLKKAQINWLELAEAGKAFETNIPLQDAVLKWAFDVTDEGSLVRILMDEGADLTFEAGQFTKGLLQYAANMGDEALKEFNEILEPVLGVTYGEMSTILAATTRRAGQVLSDPSVASRFFERMKNVSVAKKHAQDVLAEGLEQAEDAVVTEKQMLSYAQSVWKKMLVSTFPTTAINVKGWALARSSTAVADVLIAGGLLGKAGIRAVVNPAGAMKDLAKVRALAQNQAFAFRTLVDPFLSAEAFAALLDRAPTKVRKNLTGQIYGGVDDFSPSRFGLNPEGPVVRRVEKVSDFAQTISFVHLQDVLTKGITGLTRLDRESRIAFGKGIQELMEAGETWRLTDEMWENTMKDVLQETFSEDLSKGKHFFRGVAKAVQDLSSNPVFGFVVPFGKFINNTMAFTYRHSILAMPSVLLRAFKGEAADDLERSLARAIAGTVGVGLLMQAEAEKQEKGLQWFERRRDDGSIEDVTNMFPYSAFALLGRIGHNFAAGEGFDPEILKALTQQVGPLDAVSDIASPKWIKDVFNFLSDPQIDIEDKNVFLEMAMASTGFVGQVVAETAAGYTRPLDLLSRTVSFVHDEAGGGLAIDRKQAEGMDKFLLGLTRYVSGFFNLAFGEENEYGVRMYGKPKHSATSEGPVRLPNPAGTLTGTTIQPPARHLNKLLGMVDRPPYKADSFTSGNPEYDAIINREITPLLEKRAKSLLENQIFQKAPQSVKVDRVNQMLEDARNDIMSLLEGGRIGDSEDRLINERRKLLTRDRWARIRAKKALGITTDDHKLSLYEIEAIRRRMALEEETYKYVE